MAFFPFIYFSFLTYFLWHKAHRFGIGAFLAALYAISALFSVFIDLGNLYGLGVRATPEDITLVPTLLYCALITLLILPFQKIAESPPQSVVVENKTFFNVICIVYMALLLITVLLMFKGVTTVLQGDLHQMKIASRRADSVAMQTRKGGIATLISYVADFSFFLLPFFFVSLCFYRHRLVFNVLLFGATLIRVFISLLSVDRSRMLFWVYMAMFSLVFFRQFLTKQQKKVLLVGGVALASLLALYFFAVTFARFHFRSTGTLGGFIVYAGEAFPHFCNVYHNYPPVYSFYRIIPLLYSPVLSNGFTMEWDYYLQTGIETNVFTSILGVFYADLGLLGMISLVLFLHILFKHTLTAVSKRNMPFSGVMLVYAMAVLPLWGNISYWYNVRSRMMALVYCLLVAWGMRMSGKMPSLSLRRRKP